MLLLTYCYLITLLFFIAINIRDILIIVLGINSIIILIKLTVFKEESHSLMIGTILTFIDLVLNVAYYISGNIYHLGFGRCLIIHLGLVSRVLLILSLNRVVLIIEGFSLVNKDFIDVFPSYTVTFPYRMLSGYKDQVEFTFHWVSVWISQMTFRTKLHQRYIILLT